MKIKLKINGEDKRITIVPEDDSDEKLLKFVAEHNSATLKVSKKYQTYSDDKIESIDLVLETVTEKSGPEPSM